MILNGPLCGNLLLVFHFRGFSLLEAMNDSLHGKHNLGESSLLNYKSEMIFRITWNFQTNIKYSLRLEEDICEIQWMLLTAGCLVRLFETASGSP